MTPKEQDKRESDALKNDIEYRRAQVRDMEAKIAFFRDAIAKEQTEIALAEIRLRKLAA